MALNYKGDHVHYVRNAFGPLRKVTTPVFKSKFVVFATAERMSLTQRFSSSAVVVASKVKGVFGSWLGAIGYTDNISLRNNQRDNMGPDVKSDFSGIETTDNANDIIEKNVSLKAMEVVTAMFSKNKKIDDSVFWERFNLKSNFGIFSQSLKDSSTLAIYDKSKFSQEDNLFMWDYKQKVVEFARSEYKPDAGRDFAKKLTDNQNKDTIKHFYNAESYIKNPDLEVKGSDVAVFVPMIRKMGPEAISCILPCYIIKSMRLNLSSEKVISNKFRESLPFDSYSRIQKVKISYVDSSTMPQNSVNEYQNNDGVTSVNLYVNTGKSLQMAAVLHLICMFRSPFISVDYSREKTTYFNIFSFKNSNQLKNVTVFTSDPDLFKNNLAMIDSNWWSVSANLDLAESYFKNVIPHRYSAYHADSLITNGFAMWYANKFDDSVSSKFQMPSLCLPSNIGVFRILEPQTFGFSGDNINFVDIMSASILKWYNLITLISTIFFNTVRTVVDTKAANDIQQVDSKSRYKDLVYGMFDGSTTSDRIYNAVYGTLESAGFLIFCPGLVKKLYNKYYPLDEVEIYEQEIYSSSKVSFLAYKNQRITDNYSLPCFFSVGIEILDNDFNGNSIESEANGIDLYRNFLDGANTDLTNIQMELVTVSNNSIYFLEGRISRDIVATLNNVFIMAKMLNIETDLFLGEDLESVITRDFVDTTDLLVQDDLILNFSQDPKYIKVEKSYTFDLKKVIFSSKKWGFSTSRTQELTDCLYGYLDLMSKYNYHFECNWKDRALTLYTDNIDNDLYQELKDDFKSFNLTLTFIKTGIDMFLTKKTKAQPSSDFDDSGDTDLLDDDASEDGNGFFKKFVRPNDIEIIIPKSNNKVVTQQQKGFGFKKHNNIKAAEVNTSLKFLRNIVSNIILNALVLRKVDFMERGKGGKCIESTCKDVLDANKVKMGYRYGLAKADLTLLISQNNFKTNIDMWNWLDKWRISVLVLEYNTRNNESFWKVRGFKASPSSILIWFEEESHIGVVSNKTYVEISDKISERFSVNLNIEKSDVWKVVVSIMLTKNKEIIEVLRMLSK